MLMSWRTEELHAMFAGGQEKKDENAGSCGDELDLDGHD